MSGEVPWWKHEEEAKLVRRAEAAANSAGVKLGDTFLIVTEGTVTEPVYFDLLLKDLGLDSVTVCVVPGAASHPKHVIGTAAKIVKDRAQRYKKGLLANHESPTFDHVWAVIDTDVAQRESIWHDIKNLAEQRKVKLAHSTPCFEFWLLLHLGYTTRGDLYNGTVAKGAVKEMLGREYSTNKATAQEVLPDIVKNWPEAVVHGERVLTHHSEACTPPPANPSTWVCTLVRALNDCAREDRRKLKA